MGDVSQEPEHSNTVKASPIMNDSVELQNCSEAKYKESLSNVHNSHEAHGKDKIDAYEVDAHEADNFELELLKRAMVVIDVDKEDVPLPVQNEGGPATRGRKARNDPNKEFMELERDYKELFFSGKSRDKGHRKSPNREYGRLAEIFRQRWGESNSNIDINPNEQSVSRKRKGVVPGENDVRVSKKLQKFSSLPGSPDVSLSLLSHGNTRLIEGATEAEIIFMRCVARIIHSPVSKRSITDTEYQEFFRNIRHQILKAFNLMFYETNVEVMSDKEKIGIAEAVLEQFPGASKRLSGPSRGKTSGDPDTPYVWLMRNDFLLSETLCQAVLMVYCTYNFLERPAEKLEDLRRKHKASSEDFYNKGDFIMAKLLSNIDRLDEEARFAEGDLDGIIQSFADKRGELFFKRITMAFEKTNVQAPSSIWEAFKKECDEIFKGFAKFRYSLMLSEDQVKIETPGVGARYDRETMKTEHKRTARGDTNDFGRIGLPLSPQVYVRQISQNATQQVTLSFGSEEEGHKEREEEMRLVVKAHVILA